MSIQSIIQSEIQKAAAQKKKEAAASTTATQTGSTSTPKITPVPKIEVQPKKAASVAQNTTPATITTPVTVTQENAPNFFEKAKTAIVGDVKGSDVVDFFTEPLKDVRQSIQDTKQAIQESTVGQAYSLAKEKIQSGEVKPVDLFKTAGQTTLYGLTSAGTQFDKWLTEEALHRANQINPNFTEDLVSKVVGIYGKSQGLPDTVVDVMKSNSSMFANKVPEIIDNTYNDMQNYLDTKTKGGKLVSKLQDNGITLEQALEHGDVNSVIGLIGNQFGNMIPILAGGIAGGGAGAFGMALPSMAQESLDEFNADESITASEIAKRNAALGAGALKAAIESLDTMFEFFGLGKSLPVKKGVLSTFIKHKIATIFSEAGEEMAQYEVDELVAKLLGSDRDWTSFGDLVKNVGFEAALYSLFFPTGTVKSINQKRVNKMYEEIEQQVMEDIPEATPEQVQEIVEHIIEYNYKQAQGKIEEQEQEVQYEEQMQQEEQTEQELTTQLEEYTTQQEAVLTALNSTENEEERTKWLNELADINNKINEINDKLEQTQIRKEQIKKDLGENLSKQTMKAIQMNRADVSRIMDMTGPKEKKIMNKQIKNEDRARYDQLIYNLAKDRERALKELEKYSYDSLEFMYKDLDNTDGREAYTVKGYVDSVINNKKAEIAKSEKIKEEIKRDVKEGKISIETFNDIEDLSSKFFTPFRSLMLRDYGLMDTGKEKDLWGLKGVKIKDLEGKITDKVARNYGVLIAKAADRLGIDWNKVVDGMGFHLVTGEGKEINDNMLYDTLGFNFPMFSKETIKDFITKNPEKKDEFGTLFLEAQQDMTESVISLLIRGDDVRAERVLVHELMHLMELKNGIDKGLELKSNESFIGFDGALHNNDKFNTFNTTNAEGEKKIEEGDKYWYQDQEVWARYNEQYDAYQQFLEAANTDILSKEAQKVINDYNKLTESPGYWKQNEFEKLIKDRDRIMNSWFKDFLLDKENVGYSDLMYAVNNDLIFLSSNTLRNLYPNDALNKILTLERKYKEIEEKVSKLSGDIKEEVKKGYDIALSTLESNYAMALNNYTAYNEITTNNNKQQAHIDDMVNEASDNMDTVIEAGEDTKIGNDVLDDMITEPENEWNPTGINFSKTFENQVEQSVVKTEKSVDKIVKSNRKKKSIYNLGVGIKNVFKPALSRLYNINPRLAGAIHTYEARTELKTLLYKNETLKFVKELEKLKKKSPKVYRKVKLALLDWGMVEDIDIKEVLREAGLDVKEFENVAMVLNKIAQEYQEAGLDISINDKYFPRKVKDYGLLLDYLSRKTGTDIKGQKQDMLTFINDVNNNPSLSEGEKERQIHNKLINTFTKASERSNNAKERKLVLSEWLLTDEEIKQGYKNDIIDFYEDPLESLDAYITDMVKKTELKKLLGGLTKSGKAISEEFDASLAGILSDMVNRGELKSEDYDTARDIIRSIVNVKTTPNITAGIKNATYSLTIANYLSAVQQLEDLSKTLLKGPSGFKNIIKTILGRANIKMSDTGLTNAFAQLEKGGLTEFNFKFSGFNMVDSLGKQSFLNTAYDSCRKQANSKRRSIILKNRLTSMYGEEKGLQMFEDYKNGNLKQGDKLNIDLMVDLLYQLGSTQPIYKSAMPTAYLNNPNARLFYCLWSFTIKQIDWLEQGVRDVYKNQRVLGRTKATSAARATEWLIGTTIMLSLFSALVTDLINTVKGDDDETVFKTLLEDGWEEALKRLGTNGVSGLLKIFNISKYDKYIYDTQGLLGVLTNKVTPAIFNIYEDVSKILKGDADIDSLGKYGPLFIKPMYYIFKNNGMLPEYRVPRSDKKKKSDDGLLDLDLDLDLDLGELDLGDLELDLGDLELEL